MRILLTGTGGVIGAALRARFADAGHELLVLARTPKPPGSIACDFENITDEVAEKIIRFAPQVAMHPGWAGTANTERNAPRLLAINTNAAMRLLEIAARAGCARWIGFGSQAEYAPMLHEPIAETAPTEPQDNYGRAKLALYHAQAEYARAQGVEFVWLRPFACYGKNYSPTYVIPYLIGLLRRGEMPELKTPHAVWDYLHAEDAAEAVASIAAAPTAGGIYNLASGIGVSVGEMAMILADKIGFAKKTEFAAQIKANAAAPTYRVADIAKISADFGWRPRISIEEGLARCLTY